VEYASFEPRAFIHSGQDVVAHVHQVYTVKRTGKKVDEDLLLWWTFGPDGKIARLVHFEDTAQVMSAWGA
jgi:ketosteroid isomerase-like protein